MRLPFLRPRNGRPEAIVIEPTELSIGRVYKVQWKKTMPNPLELAKLYREQDLTQRQIAEIYKIRRSTVAMAIRRSENKGSSVT